MQAGVITILVTLYMGVDSLLNAQMLGDLPDIPAVVFTILGALGLWGRASANTKVTL